MTAFFEQLSRLGIGRLSLIFGLTAGVALALILLLVNPGGGSQALLYSGLQPRDAASVTERLEGAGIRYELREGGSAVYVPANQVDQARLRVASGGALGFGSVGYEIFDSNDGIGATSFVQNVNARRALEGELSRSINAINTISGARVHLVLPERRLFSREQQEPSASVVVSVSGELSAGQVSTIRNLIATAVPGLSPGRITLADDQGRLLASPNESDGASGAAIEERRSGLEAALRQRILDVVEGVVGPGAARVVVTAELDRESLTETELRFDPDNQVEVSREVQSEESQEPGGRHGAVSVSENQPGAEEGEAGQMGMSRRSTNVRNFENSRTTRTRVVEPGALRRLSVSVAVDERAVRGPDGTMLYEPRPEAEMERIRALVAAAAGMDARQIDGERHVLEVAQMSFSRPDLSAGTPAPEGLRLERADMLRIIELAVIGLIGLLIVILVARPLVRGAVGGGSAALPAPAGAGAVALPGRSGQAQLPARAEGEDQALLPEDESDDERIDVAQIDGQVKKSSVRKVASLVEQHPDETMSILRTWMHESA
ncbi:MAG: flagellar M-ring protein FliF [Oceanicaulis sp.]|nr:flagellar M-ring protein FliF [Oceanicaulis sp.]